MKRGEPTMRTKFAIGTGVALLILIWAAGAAAGNGVGADVGLKGKVHYLDKEDASLAKKMDRAAQEFKKTGKGDSYFTGYAFLSRHEFHQGNLADDSSPYLITVDEGRIKRRRAYKMTSGETTSTEEGSEIIGLVLLHKITGRATKIGDVELIDLDNTYEFEELPLYWLGQAENDDSFRYLSDAFATGEEKLRRDLLFIISSHAHPGVYDFLHGVALGNYETKVRENAIFWLGSYKDEELIRIAKAEEDQKLRKDAIFWLGQKASEESVKTLKDMVSDSDEDTKVKESAVFAISQLPSDKSVPMLIDIARTNKNPKVKKQAIFWLGQKNDDAALAFFEEILLKKK
jgi:hypothetical protein